MEATNVKNGIAKVSAKGDLMTKLANVKKLSKEQISNSVTKNKGGKQKFNSKFLEQWKADHKIESSSNVTVRNQIRNFIFSNFAIKISESYSNSDIQNLQKNCEGLKKFFSNALIDWKDYKSYPSFTGEKKAEKNTILINAYEIFVSVYDLKK